MSTLLIGTMASGQDDVTLTVFGEGVTKDAATTNALRSSIEQAYGVFVSADTKILNDQLVKDEIVTISTGNIKSYKELSQVQTSNGLYNVSLSAEVSVQNLIKYSQSHGSSAEFAGQTFTYNMKMRELNKKNEMLALNNMIEQLRSMQNDIFDYIVEVKEPQLISGNNYSVPVSVAVTANPNYENFIQIISNTLGALSLTEEEMKNYNANNMSVQVYIPFYNYKKLRVPTWFITTGKSHIYFLRCDLEYLSEVNNQVCTIINNAQKAFEVRAKGYLISDWAPELKDITLLCAIPNPKFLNYDFNKSRVIERITESYPIPITDYKKLSPQRYRPGTMLYFDSAPIPEDSSCRWINEFYFGGYVGIESKYINSFNISYDYLAMDQYRHTQGVVKTKNVEIPLSLPLNSGEVITTVTHSFEFDLESLSRLQGFEVIKKSIDNKDINDE